jgi:hypothetical protein
MQPRRPAPRPAAAAVALLASVLLALHAAAPAAAATESAASSSAAAAAADPLALAAADDGGQQWLELTRFPGVRAGAVHGARPRARRLREVAYVLGGSTSVGYYTAPMQLGSPPKTFHLILDSGSSLTVVPCKACDCGNHNVSYLYCCAPSCPDECSWRIGFLTSDVDYNLQPNQPNHP